MNKVFKVIWSEARNAYVVVSEIAKNHGSKSCSTKKLLTMLIATGVMTCASMAPAMAAPNVDASATVNVGKNAVVAVEEQAKVNVKKNAKVNVEEGAELTVKNGAKVTFSKDAGVGFDNGAKVKLGNKAGVNLADGATLSVAQGSNVSVAENITMGKGAHVSVWNGVSGQTISGDIAVGQNAHAWNGEYTYDNKYARIGTKEYLMDFGQGAVETVTDLRWGFLPVTHYKVADGSKIAGSIAIGKNTVARTGSVMLGDHSYTGKLGDIEINPANAMTYNDGIYSTTLGAGAYNSGSLAAVTGALSIASGSDTKNTGATIYGSMNSIESETSSSSYSGVASSVLGFANRTQNANAALIWGTGNEVTNSIEKVGIDTNWNNVSVAEAQKKAIEAMQSSQYAGGSVMAIGGGNKADYATYSELTGVQNKVTGTKAKAAKYDFVNGYQNTVTEASDVTVIGSKNEVTADGNKVIGDNHKVSGKDNVIFGSADKVTETTVNNAVVLGYNAKVTGEGGVALGSGSVADRANAVSVGRKDANRQIINVAAGTEDTDAVNVSQLNQTNENVAALDKRVTQNEADIAQNKADIAQNKADIAQNKTDIKNLDNRVTNVEELAKKHTTVTAGDNIAVTESTNKDGGKEYKVALNKDINLDSVTTGQTVMNNDGLKVGKDVSVTATAVIAGKTSISDEGVKVGDKTYISDKGLNANDQKVTNVAAGELSATSKDAVNGSQLYETNQAIANNATNISSLSHSISNLDNRVNKVGAGAAALAALHPLDFDPDAKWDFAAGYGNYRGANAAAVGAYYRPNEDTMFSVGGTFGNGENMVNVGVSFKLGSGSSHVSTSRVAMAKEIKELRGELEAMKSAMLDANAGKKIDTSKLQLFPDVPQNHWAYEYVAQLAGDSMIEGYPDGNFAGDRPMTRYEFAAILYRAMTKGAVLSDKILSEFSHELEYFTVDTIAKDKAGNPTIQRVRIVKENKNK